MVELNFGSWGFVGDKILSNGASLYQVLTISYPLSYYNLNTVGKDVKLQNHVLFTFHFSVGPYSTTIVVNSHAENGGLSKVVEPRGTESSEVLLTPTEAAAAGDVVLTFEEQAPGKDLEIREPAELIDSKEMGNKGSVDITSVKLTSYGDKGLQTGAKKGMVIHIP